MRRGALMAASRRKKKVGVRSNMRAGEARKSTLFGSGHEDATRVKLNARFAFVAF